MLSLLYQLDMGIIDECVGYGKILDREKWWYKLAHVCQRWQNLILASASYLGLCLVCRIGTPIADMLAHSPHIPLIICNDNEDYDVTVEAERIILALGQRDRVRCIYLCVPTLVIQKLLSLMAVHEEYPILEYMLVGPLGKDQALMLPEILQAPCLRHLELIGSAFPTGCRLLTTAVGLVTPFLCSSHPSIDFQPTVLFQWLSSMPQLETLGIEFLDRDVERQLIHEPITTHVTLPNLCWLIFSGVSALESLVRWITAPGLKTLYIVFEEQHTSFVPYHLQFMNTTKDLKFSRAQINFSNEKVSLNWIFCEKAGMYTLWICILCQHFDRQVSSMVQICDSLSQSFSAVEHLTLEHMVHDKSSKQHDEVDPTEWRKLL